jgi:hypothetical protein
MGPLVGQRGQAGCMRDIEGSREVRQTEEAVRVCIRGRSSDHRGGHVAQRRWDRTAGDKLGTPASRRCLGPEMKRK